MFENPTLHSFASPPTPSPLPPPLHLSRITSPLHLPLFISPINLHSYLIYPITTRFSPNFFFPLTRYSWHVGTGRRGKHRYPFRINDAVQEPVHVISRTVRNCRTYTCMGITTDCNVMKLYAIFFIACTAYFSFFNPTIVLHTSHITFKISPVLLSFNHLCIHSFFPSFIIS